MNFQTKPPDEVIEILKQNGIQYIDHYAWPQTFSSSAGPLGGLSAQAMTAFTVEAWVCDGSGPTVFTCAGAYAFEDQSFVPFKKIKDWRPL